MPSNNEMQLTGGKGRSRGVRLAIRRAGYRVRARVVKKRRLQLISVFDGRLGRQNLSRPETKKAARRT
jgi:hypothetical protein